MIKEDGSNKQHNKIKNRRNITVIIKYFSVGILSLILFTIIALFYLLNTNSGLKQVISIVNRYSDYQIQAEKINGNLKNGAELKKASIIGKNTSLFAENITLQLKIKENKKTDKSTFKLNDFEIPIGLEINANSTHLKDSSVSARIKASGKVGNNTKINVSGEVLYNSPETGKIKILFSGNVDNKKIFFPKININLQTTKQEILGKASYYFSNQKISINFNSKKISFPQNKGTSLFLAKNIIINIGGYLNNYFFNIKTKVKTKEIGTIPITIKGAGNNKEIKNINAIAKINNKPLIIDAKAVFNPALNYYAQIKSPEIEQLNKIPNINDLNIVIKGNKNNYKAKGGMYIYSKDIPSSDIKIDIDGSSKKINFANIDIKTLKGNILINAKGSLKPINITTNINSNNIQPQVFYPKYSGNINSNITIKAQQKNNNILVITNINRISGLYQNRELLGSGIIVFDNKEKSINISKLSLNVAGNTLKANGNIAIRAKGNSSLLTKIKAPYLNLLLPTLSGRITANLIVNGNLKNKKIKGTLSGEGLSYKNYQLEKINMNVYSNFIKDKIDLITRIEGLKINKNSIKNANFYINGKISNHKIKAQINSSDNSILPNLTLSAEGRVNTYTPIWYGTINKLIINKKQLGKWQLSKKVSLKVSHKTLNINHLCLNKKSSNICINTKLKKEKGSLDIKTKNLDTYYFASFLPKVFNINTKINGQGEISFNNNKVNGYGDFIATGGNLALIVNNSSLLDNIKKISLSFSLKDNLLNVDTNANLSKLGNINISSNIPNILKPKIKVHTKFNNRNLNFIDELFPQVTNVKGNIDTNIEISANRNKEFTFSGKASLINTSFDVPEFGTEIKKLNLNIFTKKGEQLLFIEGRAKAGKGGISILGSINPTNQKGEININGKNFKIADSNQYKITINPDIKILFTDNIKVIGNILIPKSLIIPSNSNDKITTSEDVVLSNKKIKEPEKISPIDIKITIKLGDNVRITSSDIQTKLLGQITIFAKPKIPPYANGSISINTGTIRIYGQRLNIKRGRLIFTNNPITNPVLDIRATREIDMDDVMAGVNILGYLSKPDISLFSTPSMPESSILSYLLFGKPPNSDNFSTTTLLQTTGLIGSNIISRSIKGAIGLDVLNVSLTDIEAGKYIAKKIYIGVKKGFFNALSQFIMDYKISNRTSLNTSINKSVISTDLIKNIETD